MSKTVEQQIVKSQQLITGLRKHLSNGIGGGVTPEEINHLEQCLRELASVNQECDRLRAELGPKVKHMNDVLSEAKAIYAEKKKTLKGYYPQEQWMEYGIPDKR